MLLVEERQKKEKKRRRRRKSKMANKYSFEGFDTKTMARACGSNLEISFKKTVEITNYLRGKKLNFAISFLEKVIEKKAVVPFVKFKKDMPHKVGRGISAGGYPIKTAMEVLKLLKAVRKNAEEKEISDNLVIVSISARQGTKRYHYGRYSGRAMKSTNVEVFVGEGKKK